MERDSLSWLRMRGEEDSMRATMRFLINVFSESGIGEGEDGGHLDRRWFLKWTAAASRICSFAAGSETRRRTAREKPG